jgi:Secretion system C-terminal sorting domain
MIPSDWVIKDRHDMPSPNSGGNMKRVTTLFVAVVLMFALFMPNALAETYVVNGVLSDTPQEWTSPIYNDPIDHPLDTEFIDFDDMTAPCYFSDQVALTNEYAAQGIIFSGQGEVLDECGNFGITNYSSPNFLAFNTGAGVSGPETMNFNPPITDLSLYAGQASSGTITMNAYDAGNVLVDTDVIVGAAALAQMSVAAPGITRVVLSFSGTVACFDDLVYNQGGGPDLEVIIDPINTEVPQGGGNVVFWAGVQNNTNMFITHAAWIQVQNAQSGNSVEVRYFPALTFPPNTTIGTTVTVYIPGVAPGGLYIVHVLVGNYQWNAMYWNSFPFNKFGPSADGMNVFEHPELWQTKGGFSETADWAPADVTMPDEYALSAAYPNPFNPSTSFSVNLPEATELDVSVFNVVGQQVATLTSGSYTAGSHTLTFNASNLAGGVYFVHASAQGWSAVQKVVLMK